MGAMAIGPVFNYALGSLSALIVDEYGITEGQYGFILAAVYISAGVTATFLGVLADKLTPRFQIALIFSGIVVAFLVSAMWQSFVVLLAAALIAGVAQSFSNPATNRLIAQRTSFTQRGRWMGWKQSGVQMGLLISGLTFPFLGAAFGWQTSALIGAAACVPALVIAWLIITKVERDIAARPLPPAPAKPAAPGREKLPTAVWLFSLVAFLNAVGTQGVTVYSSLFAVRALDFSLTVAGMIIGVIGVFGILSRIGWGRVAGRMAQPSVLIQIMSLGGVIGLLFLIAAEMFQQGWLMWVGILFHATLPLAANVIINSGTVAAAPAAKVGAASGLVATGMYLGFGAGPLIVGQLVDLTGSFTAGWIAVAVTYVASVVVAIILSRLQKRSK
ncbi:nitrate/nitrite transporter [Kocuria atrinae]|uniref:Nitrate/nitrite transporter n=2 Tax=Kocuria atrinae TaxID=592377 RepID=A0ABN2YBI1_9MICC